jgi:hypothetical protein
MDKKLLKKKKRAKEIKKLRNVIRNNASDQDRIDMNKDSYQDIGTDEDGNSIILKKCKSKDHCEVMIKKSDKPLNVYKGQQVHGN